MKFDCLRLEKIETSYCNLHVKSFALFRSFYFFVSVSRLFETFDYQLALVATRRKSVPFLSILLSLKKIDKGVKQTH